jgi:hypothetical protein
MRVVIVVLGALVGRRDDPTPGSLASPPIPETVRAIGRRLSQSCSERELTAIAARAAAILDRLQPGERAALGRGYLRLEVDRPVIVDVAVPGGSVPFWLGDRGFRATDPGLVNPDATWRLYRRTFDRGGIELGVNGLDRSPVAHYVVFLRPIGAHPVAGDRPVVRLAAGQEASWRIRVARPAVSAAFDAWKPFETLPPELDGAVMLQASHDRRHSTLLAAGRVWKTRVISGRRPDQVVIAFGADPARELVWTWRTSPDVATTAVRIVRAKAGADRKPPAGGEPRPDEVRIIAGDSTCVEVPNVLNDPVVRRHRVRVAGLEPDTAYDYSLGDGTPGGWGPWKSVKTAPARGRVVRLLYVGDAQTGLERWGRLLETAARAHRDLDFLVLAGDLVDRGNERTNWDHFFLRAAPVFDRMPMMPCAGNHEYLDVGPRLYRAAFELPHNGPPGIPPDLVYSFEAGDACFAVLDSTRAVWDPSDARRQAEWLDRTLARTAATWKLVMFHHPVYPSHPWRDMPALRQEWVPIFDKHHVDLVLQGHDHAYQRTYPLRAHRRVDRPGEGTVYVIAVSGDKYVDLAHRAYVEVGFAGVSTYQTIEIDPESRRLGYRAFAEDGRTVDEFLIEKPRGTGAAARAIAVR